MKKIKKSIKDLQKVNKLSVKEAKVVKGGFVIIEDLVDTRQEGPIIEDINEL